MKPIEKYQQKFIELLKEAEKGLESGTCLGYVKTREYKCSIATANDFLL